MALFLCSIFEVLAARAKFWRIVVAGLITWGVLVEFYISSETALSFHPDSATAVRWNSQFIYGEYAALATIPADRRAKIMSHLAQFQITSSETFLTHFPLMVTKAVAEQRHWPDSGLFFLPNHQALNEP